MVRLSAYSSFGAYTTEPTVQLAARISAMAPMEDAVVFFGSGGSDAVETAAKLVRRYWDVMGRPDKRLIVSREHGYHGMHGWGTSLAGIPLNKAGYGGDIIDEVAHVGWGDVAALEDLFQRRGSEIAAFVGEPVTGAGGVIPPEPDYWAEVQRLCRAHDVLLIADEVITGFGRLGTWWGSQRYAIEPDIITFAKGVTSGYVPLGGIVVGERIRRPFWDDPIPGAVFRHGYTYSGHATACAAAMANLDILEREDLLGRVRDLEPVLAAAVARLEDHPLVGETRAVGLTAAVQLSSEALAADPAAADKAMATTRKAGVVTRAVRGGALQISPAFVITETEIDALVDGFRAGLDAVAAAG
jgi:adenosylmethionine-8-amino-7-oxononanoate aminotransferase